MITKKQTRERRGLLTAAESGSCHQEPTLPFSRCLSEVPFLPSFPAEQSGGGVTCNLSRPNKVQLRGGGAFGIHGPTAWFRSH